MRFGFCFSLVFLLAGGAAPVAAATPHLVKDIDTVGRPESSSPHAFGDILSGLVFFTADDGQTGDELWRSDGTPGGTFRLADACPGECSSRPFFLGRSDHLYFFSVVGASGFELWVTDGTPGGTFFLTSVVQLPGFGTWVASQQVLYFPMDDGIHGIELWRTDGTRAGTFLVTDLRPGPAGSDIAELVVFNGKLFFRADAGQGSSLWASDGTPQGTRLVRNLAPPSVLPNPDQQQPVASVVGKLLVFTGPAPGHGVQLWRSDGTAKGTFTFTSFKPPIGSLPFSDLVVFKNRLFFVANTKGPGQLWATDGTAKGTQPLTNFHPKSETGILISAFLGNRMVFAGDDGPHGLELWTTDGTPRGTSLLKDVCPGTCSGATYAVSPSGNLLYFTGTDGIHGQEPWVSNGTAAGTHILADVCEGSCGSSPFGIRPAGGFAYFVANDGTNGRQVWRSDGTAQGTLRLTESALPLDTNIQGIVLGSVLVFTAPETSNGTELWRSDGTPQGTGLLADIDPDSPGSSFPDNLRPVGDKVYFVAATGIWKSDGTAAGTVAIPVPPQTQFNTSPDFSGSPSSLFFFAAAQGEDRSLWHTDGTGSVSVQLTDGVHVSALSVVGNLAFFEGADDQGDQLWVSDGSVAGTHRLTDQASSASPQGLIPFRGRLYFTALKPEDTHRALWSSDGTAAGTVLVSDLTPTSLDVHGGRLWFFARDDAGNSSLWSTDGTPAGIRFEPMLTGTGSVDGGAMFWIGSQLLFFGTATDLGSGLFVWDGTPGGLSLLADIGIPVDSRDPSGLVANGTLYFTGRNNSRVDTLWVSDGTVAGTRQVVDASGMPIFDPHFFQAFAGSVYFTTEFNLYQTDGTTAGTLPLLKINAPSEIMPHELVAAGPRLFFRKWDPATGAELWALEAN